MKRSKTHISRTREKLKEVLKDPKAKLVENKYKAIRATLVKINPRIAMDDFKLSPEALLSLVEDAIALDREWRMETQDIQKDKKKELSQNWQINHGYTPNYENDIKKLQTL